MSLQEQPHHLPRPPQSFPELVFRCRKELGLNQTEFAERSDGVFSQMTVSKWEQGQIQTMPRRDTLLKLAEMCGTPPGRLLELLGYWGADVALDELVASSKPALRELLEAARPLSTHQLRALTAVAREMGRS